MILGQPAVTVIGTITLLTLALSWFWNKHVLDRLHLRAADGCGSLLRGRIAPPHAADDEQETLADAVGARGGRHGGAGARARLGGVPVRIAGHANRLVLHRAPLVRAHHLASDAQCPQRGYFRIGPVTIRAGDPFGFFAHRQSLPGEQYLTVYPRLVALDDLGLPPRHLLGETNVRRTVITDPTRTIGTREYRPEDPFKAIHWKASARAGAYQTKVYEPTANLQIAIFLNLDTVTRYYEGVDQEHLERAISVAASIAQWADTEKYAVGIFANGLLAQTDQMLRIPPGRREDQYARILEGLARLTPFTYVNIAGTLEQESPRFPWGSTVIVVTMTMTDALRRRAGKARAARLARRDRRARLRGRSRSAGRDRPPSPVAGRRSGDERTGLKRTKD